MRYLSVCSGIEAASVAWEPLGWEAAGFSEIAPFPSAVLAHRFPNVPNLGDMTKYREWDLGGRHPVDVLVGGTPCQAFSVQGLRKGLDDPRGNLALVFLGLADRFRPRWVLWENVAGVLSSNGGRDFGAFLGGLVELGYGVAYRVLDAQHFGVPQRRRRVFVVGHLGDWRRPSAVLLEPESLRRSPASRGRGQPPASPPESLDGRREDPLIAFSCKDNLGDVSAGVTPTLRALAHDQSHANGGGQLAIYGDQPGLRRLTPLECERLQGFPDGWTQVPWKGRPAAECPDSIRYMACGNSMAVPVMRWIGERIAVVDALQAGADPPPTAYRSTNDTTEVR